MAVNETTGEILQVSEGGYTGILCVAQKSMRLYFMRIAGSQNEAPMQGNTNRSLQIIEVDLAKLFTDSKAKSLKSATTYQRICGITPVEMGAGGDMALDGAEEWVYFRVGKTEA